MSWREVIDNVKDIEDRLRMRLGEHDPEPSMELPRGPGVPPDSFVLELGDSPGPPRVVASVTATQETHLVFTSFGAYYCNILLTGFMRYPNGAMTPIGPNGSGIEIQVIGDRVQRSAIAVLGSGVVLESVNVIVASSLNNVDVPLGGVWFTLKTFRFAQDGVTRLITNTLLSGPVSKTQSLGLGSAIRTTFDLPGYSKTTSSGLGFGLGLEMVWFVPLGLQWELKAMQIDFTSGASAGTRQTVVFFTDIRGVQFGASWGLVTCGPSSGYQIDAQINSDRLAAMPPGGGATGSIPLHDGTLIGGTQINTFTTNLGAGDLYKASFLFNERLDPL